MRRTVLAAGAVAALLWSCAVVAQTSLAITADCSLGRPPGAPGFAEEQARKQAEMRTLGYEQVCEATLDRYDIAFMDSARVLPGLAFPPVDLAATPFARFKSLGAVSETMNLIASRLYRGFQLPDGHVVTLFEHDMSADNTSMWRDPALETVRVNGLPARLVVMRAPSGKTVSSLTWLEGRRLYDLWMNANAASGPLRQQLFALAESLPKSRPACPNRPARKPPRLGPDGFPEVEPMPETLTVDAMNKLMEQENQPCR